MPEIRIGEIISAVEFEAEGGGKRLVIDVKVSGDIGLFLEELSAHGLTIYLTQEAPLCGMLGRPQGETLTCELKKGHKGAYHKNGSLRWIGLPRRGGNQLSDTVQPSDAFGLLRSFLAHRAYLAEATGLVGSDLARRATSRINAAAPERSKLAGQAAEKQRGLPDDATYWEAHGAARMTFLDVIEMVCDWFAAWKCYGDTRSWADSSALNLEKKGEHLSPAQRWLAEEVIVFLAERAK